MKSLLLVFIALLFAGQSAQAQTKRTTTPTLVTCTGPGSYQPTRTGDPNEVTIQVGIRAAKQKHKIIVTQNLELVYEMEVSEDAAVPKEDYISHRFTNSRGVPSRLRFILSLPDGQPLYAHFGEVSSLPVIKAGHLDCVKNSMIRYRSK